MALLCILVLLAAGVVSSNTIQSTDDLRNGSELIFAFMVVGHGHRTFNPTFYPFMRRTDLESVMPLINQLGNNRLTDVGKRSAFKVGQFIRRRYGQLLSPQYNDSEIYIRSIDVPSAAMTALIAMSAVYPANHTSWTDDVSWDPVPYSTVPVKYDYNCAIYNCDPLTSAIRTKLSTPNSRMDRFAGLISNISNIMGVDKQIKNKPVNVFLVYRAYTNLIKLGYIKINHEILELMPAMKEASDEAFDVLIGDDEYLNLEAGPLLNEFYTKARAAMRRKSSPRVMVYSGDASNVFSFMAVNRVKPKQGYPKYGSVFSLELRKIETKVVKKYFVQPVYLSEPGAEEIELTVDDCPRICDFASYKIATRRYILSENKWRARCGITNSSLVPAEGLVPIEYAID